MSACPARDSHAGAPCVDRGGKCLYCNRPMMAELHLCTYGRCDVSGCPNNVKGR